MALYIFLKQHNPDVRILASGITLRLAIEASEKLKEFGLKSDIWVSPVLMN